MKPIALALLVLFAAGLYWVISGEVSGTVEALTLEPEFEQANSNKPAALPALPDAPGPEEASHASERSLVEAPEEALGSVATPPAVQLLSGQVILSDVAGARLGTLNGTLEMLRWTENRIETEVVEVHQGHFKFDAQGLSRITIGDVELDGRGAMLAPEDQEFALDQGPLQVLVRWTPAVQLSVVSAESGEHLSGIRLVQGAGWPSESGDHPGRFAGSALTISDGVSPLELQASASMTQTNSITYHVHSPGYAWENIRINYASGGEREVRLVRGGALSIRLIGELPAGGARVDLVAKSSATGEPEATLGAATEEAVEIEDLVPGHYLLRVQKGKWYDNPVVYGELEVEVIAGVRGEYELALEVQAPTAITTLSGTLVVPASWEFESFRLSAEFDGTAAGRDTSSASLRGDQMQEKVGERDAWSFDFGEMVAGTYELAFRGRLSSSNTPSGRSIQYAIQVEALPGDAGTVRFELPEPAQVSVRLLDSESGDPTKVGSIHWGPIVPPATWATVLNTVQPNEAPGTFEFRAPLGTLSLGSFGGDFTSLKEQVQIRAGNNEFTFRLHRNCPLVILFLDGESAVPAPDFWFPTIEHLDGDGKLLFTTSNQTGFKTALGEPGRYVFQMPEIDGFEPIPDQTIRVVSGEMTTYKVQLVREK